MELTFIIVYSLLGMVLIRNLEKKNKKLKEENDMLIHSNHMLEQKLEKIHEEYGN